MKWLTTPKGKTKVDRIPVVTVSYNSPDLIREVLTSFRRFYKNPYYIIDGSDPGPLAEIKAIVASFQDVELIPFGYNIHHGPGLAWAITNLNLSGPVLFLDSDVSVEKGGFLETLVQALKPKLYGVGNVQWVNAAGHNVPDSPEAIPYLHPACMLCNFEVMKHWALPVKHGAPMIETMAALKQAGQSGLLADVPWVGNDFAKGTERIYLAHDWQGTVLRTGGYHLEPKAAPAPDPLPEPGPGGFNPDLLRLIPGDAQRLVEIGCASGALAAAYRKRNPGCHYLGVNGLEAAAAHCDAVLQVDLETAGDAFFASMADRTCWILGNALERMRSPWEFLARVRAVLPRDGCVVACLPNAQHWLLQAKLAIGDFRYDQDGLLDRAHLRWFTRATLFELFQNAGFKVVEGNPRIFDEPGRERILPAIRMMAQAVGADPDLAEQDSLALQYVVRAEPV